MATINAIGSPTGYTLERAIVTTNLTANSGDVVQLMAIQPGWVIYSVDLNFVGTASSTASVGDTGNAARYISATTTATTGFLSTNVPTAITSSVISAGPGYQYTAADTLQMTIGGATVTTKEYAVSITFSRNYNN